MSTELAVPTAAAVTPATEQAQNRMGFIGGSDIASIIGISPWKSAYALWEEKQGEMALPADEAREKVFRRGKRLEPVVMEMLQEEHDISIASRNRIYIDGQHEWMRAEIDFEWDSEDGIANGDVKTVHPFAAREWGEQGTDEFPAYYAAQFQWGMMITGAAQCLVAALIGADDLRLYTVNRDDGVIEYLRNAAIGFWENYVLPNVAPPVATKEDALKVLARFDGRTVEASPELYESVVLIKRIKAAEKRLATKRAALELKIQLTMAVATPTGKEPDRFALVGTNGSPLVTWNYIRRAGYTVEPNEYRVFKVR